MNSSRWSRLVTRKHVRAASLYSYASWRCSPVPRATLYVPLWPKSPPASWLDWYQQGHCRLHPGMWREPCRCKIPEFGEFRKKSWILNFEGIYPEEVVWSQENTCLPFLCTPTHPGDAPRYAAFIPGCTEDYAGRKFRRLGSSDKLSELEILKEFIQYKSIGRQKTRACRFNIILCILAMLPGAQSNALRAIMVIQKIPLDCVIVRLSSTCWWLQFHFIFLDLLLILLAKFSHFTGDVLGLMNENIFRFS